jgi:tetratricopeptide (TPR) repeat protein
VSSKLSLWAVALLLGAFFTMGWIPVWEAIQTNLVADRVMKEAASPTEVRPKVTDEWLDSVLKSTLGVAGMARLGGYHYLHQGQVADAVGALENARTSDRVAAFWLGKAYDLQGRHNDATAAYQRAGAAMYFLERGHPPYEMGDYETACRNYLRAVEIAPQMAIAHMYMGHCLVRRGEYLPAETSYRRAIELDPQFGYPYLHLASLLREHLQLPNAARDVLLDCIARVESAYWRRECLAKSRLPTLVEP